MSRVVREVVLMGGGYPPGNMTPVTELNIAIDPEAAHMVFNESWPVVMVRLDLPTRRWPPRPCSTRIATVGTRPAQVVVDIPGVLHATAYAHVQGFSHPPVHDPCAVAYLIDPSGRCAAPRGIELPGALTRTA